MLQFLHGFPDLWLIFNWVIANTVFCVKHTSETMPTAKYRSRSSSGSRKNEIVDQRARTATDGKARTKGRTSSSATTVSSFDSETCEKL